MTDIAVIGGGIAGASVAYHLGRAGDHRVVVYERGDLAGATTARSAAFFGFYGSDVERRLKRYGMATYNEFFADPRADPRHDLVGRVRVATTDDGARSLGGADGTLTLEGGELHERVLVPELDASAVVRARYRPHVGYHRPTELAREFVARAREAGVGFETGRTVEDVLVEDGTVAGLVVDGETVAAGAVVCAAGPWNPEIAGLAGVDLPVHHSLAPILVLEREDAGHTLPIVSHAESGAYARGGEDGRVLVGHHPTDPDPDTRYDPGAVEDTVPDGIRERLWAFVDEVLPALADAPVVDEWVGVRSHTPDGHPIAGWTNVEGFSVAAFNSSGIQLSPGVGRVIARQLLEGEPTEEHDALSLARFDGHADAPFSL